MLAILLGKWLLASCPPCNPSSTKATMSWLHSQNGGSEPKFCLVINPSPRGSRPPHLGFSLLCFPAVLAVYILLKLLLPRILLTVIKWVPDILEAFCNWKRGKRVPQIVSPVT